MDQRLTEAIEFIARDLRATAHLPFQFIDEPEPPGDERLSVWFQVGASPGRTMAWIWPDDSLAQRIGTLLDVIQQEVLEARADAGLWAYWPRCPWHPRSHPLDITLDDSPRWRCHTEDRPTPWLVGSLPSGQTPP